MSAVPPRLSSRLSVVIAHLNQPAMLDRCLASLAAGTRRPDEVIVVDNGSREPPAAVCAAHGARLLHEATPGPGPARTTGARAAGGDVIAFIDADCLADAGWLAAAEAAMADPAAMILGGDVQIAYADPDPGRMTMIEAYESVYGYRVADYIARDDFTVTCNLVTRPAVMADVGAFGGLAMAEDIDWGRRAVARGYRILYRPEMVVRHPARPDMRALRIKWDRHMAHFFHEVRGPRARAAWALRTLAMAVSPLAELPRLAAAPRLPGLRARALAFLCLARIRLYRARMMAWLLFGGDPAVLAGRWNRSPAATAPR
jgi:glycosyltransferase involved in cell wall biosynthesis